MSDGEIAEANYPESYNALKQYVDILANRGIEWGLVGPKEKDRLWGRHVLNSLAIAELLPEGVSVVDVGSGAGLPGIPLAIVRADLQVTLLEPLLRRYEFLGLAVAELGLEDRVTVERGRAEDSAGHYDAVVCRAVAPLPKLLKWVTPLFYPDGKLYALKGSSAGEEVAEAEGYLSAAGLRASVRSVRAAAEAEPTSVVVVQSA